MECDGVYSNPKSRAQARDKCPLGYTASAAKVKIIMSTNSFYVGGGAAKSLAEVAMLQKKYELFDQKIIPEIFQKTLGLKVTAITKPEIVGLPHVTFFVQANDGQEYCFRANLGNEAAEIELKVEKLVSDLVRKAGVQANTILYVDCSRQNYAFDFQIQEKIQGKNPEHNFTGNQQDYDKVSYDLGQIIGKLSLIQIPGFGTFNKGIANTQNKLITTLTSNYEYISHELVDQIAYIVAAEIMTKDQGEKIQAVFEGSQDLININTGSIVHYDLADHNFFYDPKTFKIVGLFDWESVCVSDSLLDLASAPTWKTLYPREDQLMAGFTSIAKLPENYQQKMDLYKLRTVIWKLVHNLKFKLLNQERLDRYHNALKPFGI